uniref:Uncharacterized protein n=1 Tax=Glossina palpalis gambiensis TaxID=67801 RepID=A0A1B0BM96_9MUSC
MKRGKKTRTFHVLFPESAVDVVGVVAVGYAYVDAYPYFHINDCTLLPCIRKSLESRFKTNNNIEMQNRDIFASQVRINLKGFSENGVVIAMFSFVIVQKYYVAAGSFGFMPQHMRSRPSLNNFFYL